jgi:Tol biopolymer transport system component
MRSTDVIVVRSKYLAIFALFVLLLLLALPVRAGLSLARIAEQRAADPLTADTPWPMYQHDPQHTGRSPLLGPQHQLELLWTALLPYCSGENGGIAIAQDGSLLLPVGGCLHSFDPLIRQVRWTYAYGGSSRSTPLVSADGSIYWGYANIFDNISLLGSTNWRAELDPNYVFGSSASFGADGNLYFMHDGLWSFTPAGAYRWFFPYGWYGSHAAPGIGLDGMIYGGGAEDMCAYRPDSSFAWCLDTPGDAYDKTPAVGGDGTIYMPAWGNLEPPYTDAGILTAISTTGVIEWTFQPEEMNDSGIHDGMVIAEDGSINFSLNTGSMVNYLYAVDVAGQFRWKVPLPAHPLTGINSFMRYPLTLDQAGNTFVCPENSRCYGIGPDGSILWQYEFPLVDSIPVMAGTQPVIAANGLFYVFDNHYLDQARLYAFADPLQYPILKTSVRGVHFDLETGTPAFTATIPITSTTGAITLTVSITPEVGWLSIAQPLSATPTQLTASFEPEGLPAGSYRAQIQVRPVALPGAWLDIPVTLNVGVQPVYLPVAMRNSRPLRILFASQWFTDAQLASIEQTGKNRLAVAHHLPAQIDWMVYAPDGSKVAAVPFIDGKHQIDVINAVTGQTILEIGDSVRSRQPTWSPDSERIAFYSERDDPNGELYAINLDGSGLVRLTNNTLHESNLLWSPGGDRIAVEVNLARIYLMKPDGTDIHPITPENESYGLAGWSPDGQSLLLKQITNYGMTTSLVVYNLQSGEYLVLTDHYYSQAAWSLDGSLTDHYISRAAWSPDGEWIVYVGWGVENFDWDICVIRPDGSGQADLTLALDREDTQPVWSGDSRWLAFTSRRDDIANDMNYDIYVIRPDGTGLKQVTTNIQGDSYPFWMP